MPLKHSSLQDVAQYLLKATQDRDGLRNDCGLEIGGSTNLMLIDGSEILQHLGCRKPSKYWDKLPTSTG